jgi:hypothetical protein
VQNPYQVASTGTFLDQAALQAKTETNNFSLNTTAAAIMLTDPFNNATPNLKPAVGSPALTGAKFDLPQLMEPFFTSVAYRGAFDGTTDWGAGKFLNLPLYPYPRRDMWVSPFLFCFGSINVWHIKRTVPEIRRQLADSQVIFL